MSTERKSIGRQEQPPSAVVLGGVAVIVAAAVMMVWGAWTTGISWDEPYHVQRLTNFLTHGWYLIDDNLIDGEPHDAVGDTYVYAPLAALLAHAANVLVGNETLGEVATSPSAIAVRHLTIAFIGMVGTLAAVGMARLLTRSWRWAVVAGALLSAMPAWTGHTMFNIKDVPVATGYTLASLGLMLLVHAQVVAAPVRRRTLVLGVVVAITGIVLAVGTRPGIWPGPVAAVGIVVLTAVLRRQVRAAIVVGVAGLGVGLVSWAVLAAVYPAGFLNFTWILGSVSSSASYGSRGSPLYVPRTALIEIPTVVLLLVLFSVCVWWLSPKARGLDGHRVTLVAVILAQTLLIPALATAGGSPFYDGLRQILFGYPTFAVLVTLVLRAAVRSSTAGPWTRRLLTTMALMAMVLPTVVQARLFPYNYAFTSELGAAGGLSSRGDYWRTSLRELSPEIPEDAHLVCTPVLGPDDTYWRFSPLAFPLAARANDCRRDPISPVAPYLSPSDPSAYPLDSFLEVSSEFFGDSSNCTVLGEVTRTPYFTPRRISEVSRCELSLRPYPAGGVELDGEDPVATTFLLGDWTGRHDRPGVSVLGSTGALGFALEDAAVAGVTIVFETAGGGGTKVEVNGTPIKPRLVAPGKWHARASGAVADALGDGRLLISWTPEDPEWALLAVSLEQSRR